MKRAVAAAALVISVLTGCDSASTPTAPPTPTPTPTPTPVPTPLAVTGIGFATSAPAGWTLGAQQQASGITEYPLSSASVTGGVGVIPFPATSADRQTLALETEDINLVAQTVVGAQTGTSNIVVDEAPHHVIVAGETCSQMGISTSANGQQSDGRSMTCRHGRAIYAISLVVTGGTNITEAVTALGSIVAAWRWTA